MKKIGILGAAAALLLFAVGSQATTISGSYGNVTANGWLSQHELNDSYPLFGTFNNTFTVDEGSTDVKKVRLFWWSNLDIFHKPLAQTVSIDFEFLFGNRVVNQTITGENIAWGIVWDFDTISLPVDDTHALTVSIIAENCMWGTCFSALLQDPPLSGAIAVPAPGVLILFALAVGMLGGVVVVRRRRASSPT